MSYLGLLVSAVSAVDVDDVVAGLPDQTVPIVAIYVASLSLAAVVVCFTFVDVRTWWRSRK
ncbi:MAG: hypothetical protein ABUS47_12050 [Steroidobacter sp.]